MATPKESRRLVAGNWKMNLDHQAGCDLATAVVEALGNVDLPVVFCAPAIHLNALHAIVKGAKNVHTGGQDISSFASGAHTGEHSGSQLKSVGCDYVIVGHSERRADHGEAGELLASKVNQALENGLTPIYCFGETLDQREAGNEEKIVAHQLEEGLAHLDAAAMAKVVLAYEPVWAIGTGVTASPAQAQAIHAFIRNWLTTRFGESLAAAASILYGGSVKPANANELFNQPDIDGGLIGGASLKSADFVAIAKAY
ncbi:MAG: triose-phosphate isomerase [Saprospiraceae bacterium]